MKHPDSNYGLRASLLAGMLLAAGVAAWSADTPTLKDAYQEHFPVGVAVNRSIATGTPSFRRSTELVKSDLALTNAPAGEESPSVLRDRGATTYRCRRILLHAPLLRCGGLDALEDP
jgi:hypothetical protein